MHAVTNAELASIGVADPTHRVRPARLVPCS